MLEQEVAAGGAAGQAPAQCAPGSEAAGSEILLRAGQDATAHGAGSADAAAPGAGQDGAGTQQAEAQQTEALRQTHWQDFVRQQQADHSRHVQDWRRMTADDAEIGGARLAVSVARAQWALNRMDPDKKLGQWMEESGMGNHPEVIRLFNRIADAIGDDTVVDGRVAREMPSLEERMYPNWKV